MSKIANSLHKGCQRPIMMKRLRTYHSRLYQVQIVGKPVSIILRVRVDLVPPYVPQPCCLSQWNICLV